MGVVPKVLAAACAALMVGAPLAHASAPRHSVGRSTSTNWSGYDVTTGGATFVTGTWTQPSATCSPGESSWSSPWVGIDGDTSNTVEQIGTDSDCQSGTPTYYAWYEMYPKGLVQIPMTVTPGKSYTGTVTYSGGTFVMTLSDGSHSFTTSQSSKRAKRASAEWIMEGPSSGLLTDFGNVPFTGASATMNGATVGPSASGAITMVTKSGAPRATPSLLGPGSFGVAWDQS